MAKPPPEEYFKVTVCPVSKMGLGTLMAELSRMNLNVTGCELVTDVRTFNKRTNHDTNAEEFLTAWIADHPTFKAKEAVVHFDLHGRTAGAAYTALRALSERGDLKKLGNGNYARKDVKSLAAPKKAAKPTKPHEIVHTDFIMKFAAKHNGKLVRADVMEAFKKDKRNPTAVSTSLKSLISMGKIERVQEGVYAVIKSKSNGNGAAEATQHG